MLYINIDMLNNIISFIYGIIINIVDDIYDMNILQNYKLFFEGILLIITIYIIFFTKRLGLVLTILFTIGFFPANYFIPHTINDRMWKVTIALSFIGLLYHFDEIKTNLQNYTKKDYNDILYLILPILVICAIFWLVADKICPDNKDKSLELSNFKLYDRLFQVVVLLLLIKYLPSIIRKKGFKQSYIDAILYGFYGWLGAEVCSFFIILFLRIKKML